MDPWGEQRADLRAALVAIAGMQTKSPPLLSDLMLFPDERNDLPEDVAPEEQQWMLALNRNEGD